MPDCIKVVGLDPSLRNWGIAIGTLDLDSLHLTVDHIETCSPVLSKGKQIRQNSLDLESAYQLTQASLNAIKGAKAVFAEVPVGSQSSRAMASYGICVGVLGALRAFGIPIMEVTPTEVKLAAAGSKTATKEAMIAWGVAKHPEANWPTYKRNGESLVSEAVAEHMADAIAAIYAGIKLNHFKQLLALRTAIN